MWRKSSLLKTHEVNLQVVVCFSQTEYFNVITQRQFCIQISFIIYLYASKEKIISQWHFECTDAIFI